MNEESALFWDLTQAASILMLKMGLTKSPDVLYFKEDGGILESLYEQHKQLQAESLDAYLKTCGKHALGAGIYTAMAQAELHKTLNQFSEEETKRICRDFEKMDAYELGLRSLDIEKDSHNQYVLDQIYLFTLNMGRKEVGAESLAGSNLRLFMQVLFNAGVTLVYSL